MFSYVLTGKGSMFRGPAVSQHELQHQLHCRDLSQPCVTVGTDGGSVGNGTRKHETLYPGPVLAERAASV